MEKIAVICAGSKTVAYDFSDNTRSNYLNLFAGNSVVDGHQNGNQAVGRISGFNVVCIDLNYWAVDKGLTVGGRSNKFTAVLNYVTSISSGAAITFDESTDLKDIVLSGNYFVYQGNSAIEAKPGYKVGQSKVSLNLFQGQEKEFVGFDSFTPGWEMVSNGVQIPDSKAKVIAFMNDNTQETTFDSPDLFQSITGSLTPLVSNRFTINGDKLTFTGRKPIGFDVIANVSGIAGYQNSGYSIAIIKNGNELIKPKSTVSGLNKGTGFQLRLDSQVRLEENDFIQLVIKSNMNKENKPVTITDVTLKIDQF